MTSDEVTITFENWRRNQLTLLVNSQSVKEELSVKKKPVTETRQVSEEVRSERGKRQWFIIYCRRGINLERTTL